MKTILQIPMDKNLKIKAENMANNEGFSSLQEMIRVLLKQFVTKKAAFSFGVSEPDEYITPEQEAVLDTKFAVIQKNIKKGKFIKSSNVDELMAYLNK